MKRPSILHIGKFYPPHRGGMETHLYDLVRHQSERFDVTVLVSNSSPRTVSETLDNAYVWRTARFGTVASMPVCPSMLGKIASIQPDLIHLHTPNPLGALAVARSGFKGPIVITHHSDTLGRPVLRRLVSPILSRVYRQASAVIATSERYLRSSAELSPYRSKCVVIPLGLELDAKVATKQETLKIEQPANSFGIVSIGRLVPYKGFEYLIDAMDSVDSSLLIIGRGPLRKSLDDRIRSRGLSHKVRIIGTVDDVQPYLKSADIFVLPSVTRAEAFGVVQLEAMNLGLPVINTAIDSGVPEVSVHEVTGLTVAPGDSAALASAMNALLGDESLRMRYGDAARRRIEQHYRVEGMAEQVAQLYGRLLDQTSDRTPSY